MKRTNEVGRALIKAAEGKALQAYVCPAGVKTIGYGHTGVDVKLGQVITEAQAEELLSRDLAKFEADVARLCPSTTDNQFSALVSFAYNVGAANLAASTLRKKHNAGDYTGAKTEFGKWVRGGGRVLPGLVKRRAAEADLYGRP